MLDKILTSKIFIIKMNMKSKLPILVNLLIVILSFSFTSFAQGQNDISLSAAERTQIIEADFFPGRGARSFRAG